MTLAFASVEFVLAWPWALAVLPLPWLVWRFAPPRVAAQRSVLRVPDASRFALEGVQSGAAPPARSMWWLTLMWLALVAALMRPQVLDQPLELPRSGRDLMLAIDISGSMDEQDLYTGNRRATRMAVVREVAKSFVQRRGGDRIGLVMFGSQAYVQAPLTTDHATVQHFLDEAAVGLAGRDTAIGDAIGLSVKRLRETDGEARVLVLLTDGTNTAGEVGPLEAARVAALSGIRVHTIGVGSEARAGFAGVRRSQLDERTLRSISEATGGRYFRARSLQELEEIYRVIDRIEPTAGDPERLRPRREMHAWPLAVALFASLSWAWLSRRAPAP